MQHGLSDCPNFKNISGTSGAFGWLTFNQLIDA